MKRLFAALAAMVIALTVAATPAFAVSAYCRDLISPVYLTADWVTQWTMQAETSAPINSTADLYVYTSQSGWQLIDTHHQTAGALLDFYEFGISGAKYLVYSWGDTGQQWYDGNGNRSYCRSPARTLP